MKIKTFGVAQMRQQQAFGFYQKCREKLDPISEITFLEPFIAKFSSSVVLFDQALKPLRKSLLTEEITKADERRDNAWRGLKMSAQILLIHFDPEYVQLGKEANRILSAYGDPTRLPYTEETAVIHNLSNDLHDNIDPLKLSGSGLSNWLNELDAANSAFKKLEHERHDQKGMLISGESKLTRQKTDDAYKDLVEKINAYVIISGITTNLRKVITGINLLIDEENVTLKVRRTRNSNKKENEENTSPESE